MAVLIGSVVIAVLLPSSVYDGMGPATRVQIVAADISVAAILSLAFPGRIVRRWHRRLHGWAERIVLIVSVVGILGAAAAFILSNGPLSS